MKNRAEHIKEIESIIMDSLSDQSPDESKILAQDLYDGIRYQALQETKDYLNQAGEVEAMELLLNDAQDQQRRQQTLDFLNTLDKQDDRVEAKVIGLGKKTKWLSIAASIAVIILAGWWIIKPNSSSSLDSLFTDYYHLPAHSYVNRSEQPNIEEVIRTAFIEFDAGLYATAKEKLNQLYNTTDNSDFLFYSAIASMELDQYEEAATGLKQVLELEPSNMDAHWYFGLVKLKQNKEEEAIHSLSKVAESTNFRARQAADLLRDLNTK